MGKYVKKSLAVMALAAVLALLTVLANVAVDGELISGAKAEEGNAGTFIFEDKELLKKLYDGLIMNGVPYETVVEGYYSATDNTTNEQAAVLYRQADGMEITFLTDKGVRNPESKITLTKISYIDFEGGIKFSFCERYDDGGNPIYFIYLDEGDNRIVNYQLTEVESRRGVAALNALPLKDDINAKGKAFVHFCVEMGAIDAAVASKLVPEETKASEAGSSIFDEERLNIIFSGFVKDGEMQVDGFVSENGVSRGDRNFLVRTANDDIYLEFRTDEDITDPDSKITQVLLYSVSVETKEYYGFVQSYTYNKKGQKSTNNIIFFGPMGSDTVTGNDGLSDEDFENGVNMLTETQFNSRKEKFDAFFEEMDRKYDPK